MKGEELTSVSGNFRYPLFFLLLILTISTPSIYPLLPLLVPLLPIPLLMLNPLRSSKSFPFGGCFGFW